MPGFKKDPDVEVNTTTETNSDLQTEVKVNLNGQDSDLSIGPYVRFTNILDDFSSARNGNGDRIGPEGGFSVVFEF